jgi:hypothetical protein
MTKEELWKQVKPELEWFTYYGFWEDKVVMDMDKSLYDQVRSIGYTKVVTDLDLRCVGYLSFKWVDGMSVSDLVPLMERRDTKENKFSPMEVWLKLYPEDKQNFYNKLNKIENE